MLERALGRGKGVLWLCPAAAAVAAAAAATAAMAVLKIDVGAAAVKRCDQ